MPRLAERSSPELRSPAQSKRKLNISDISPAPFSYKATDEGAGYLDFYSLGYLTPAEGSYRLISDKVLAFPDMPIRRARMGGPASAFSLITRVQPKYLEKARQNRVSGTVRMHALIATDGSLKQIDVLSGDAL